MKLKRHEKIIELVNKYEIETQEELASLLNQAGFRVTQATISRDIRELRLSKVNSHDGHGCSNGTGCYGASGLCGMYCR